MQLSKWALALGMTTTMLAGQVQAADQGHGKVTFTGAIIDAPCSITPDTIEQTVDLGEISNKALTNGGKSRPRSFDIKLESCDLSGLTDKTVTITFTGTESRVQPGYLALVGTASGAAIAGKVILRKRRNADAPSRRAASNKSSGIVCNAASTSRVISG